MYLGNVWNARMSDFRIGKLDFDPSTGDLEGGAGSRRLEPRAAAVLAVLLRASGEVVSRRQLLAQCWSGDSGSDEALTQAVAQIRRNLAALGEPADRIATLAKRGYRISACAPPIHASAVATPSAEPARAGPAAMPVRHAVLVLASLAAIALIGWGAFSPAPRPAARHGAHEVSRAAAAEGAPGSGHGHVHDHRPEEGRHAANADGDG